MTRTAAMGVMLGAALSACTPAPTPEQAEKTALEQSIKSTIEAHFRDKPGGEDICGSFIADGLERAPETAVTPATLSLEFKGTACDNQKQRFYLALERHGLIAISEMGSGYGGDAAGCKVAFTLTDKGKGAARVQTHYGSTSACFAGYAGVVVDKITAISPIEPGHGYEGHGVEYLYKPSRYEEWFTEAAAQTGRDLTKPSHGSRKVIKGSEGFKVYGP